MTQISILPPNSTPLERALEATFAARLDALPLPVGHMMNPATCPAAFLPWLAWALSVDDWSSDWTEETQRAAIKASVGVHRRKGTVGALKAAIAAAGYGDVEVIERYGLVRRDGSRWYNGGNDNYVLGATDFSDTAFWAGGVQGGVTTTIIGTGLALDGTPYVDVSFSGQTTTGSGAAAYVFAKSRTPAVPGQTWTGSLEIVRLSGSLASMRVVVVEETAPAAAGVSAVGNSVSSAVAAISTATRVIAAGRDQVRLALQWVAPNGVTLADTFRISGLQLEIGSVRTQIVPFVFTHGSPDHWAEYRMNIARPVTIAQAAQIRRIAAGVAPARCHLKEIIYPSAQHLHNGAIARNGTFAHGAA